MAFTDLILFFGAWRYDPTSGALQPVRSQACSIAAASQVSLDKTADDSNTDASYSYDEPPTKPTEAKRHIVLEPRLHALLNYFLENPDRVIAKAELLDNVWGNDEGTDAALMRAIGMLRKALQDQSKPPVYIETLSKRGYRWLAPIQAKSSSSGLLDASIAEGLKPATEQTLMFAKTSQAADVVEAPAAAFATKQYSFATKKKPQRPIVMLAVFFACAVLCLFSALLLFLHQSSPDLVFNRQIILSAVAGREQLAIALPGQSVVFYQQQTSDGQWRWLRHETVLHTKQVASKTYQQIGAAQVLNDNALIYPVLQQQQCKLIELDLITLQEQHWADCQTFIPQALVVRQQQLWWLDQDKFGETQLWRWHAKKAVLSHTFAAGYRRPQALAAVGDSLWVLLQQDELNTSLFQMDPQSGHVNLLADFPFDFTDVTSWKANQLLLSNESGAYIFESSNKKLIPLQLPTGSFSNLVLLKDRLLATASTADTSDLLPLEHAGGAREPQLLAASPWLNSNKDESLLSWSQQSAAFVSNRTGLPQIWLYRDGHARQLSQFKQWSQISQLVWSEQQLYAVIDLQLGSLNLSDGQFTPLNAEPRVVRHYALCNGAWYWAEFNSHKWFLKSSGSDLHQVELLADVQDVRCAPEQSLVVQLNNGQFRRYWPKQDQWQDLPVQIGWREHSRNSWVINDAGIYWLNSNNKIIKTAWTGQQTELPLASNIGDISALYSWPEHAEVVLQLKRNVDSEIVYLLPPQSKF